MPRITIELLRKRSEHNEGVISTLEEISLHQEELEKIEVIGSLCRRLRILYLQNNIIEKIEDLTHMKELRYLNLALNNISKIEGLQACEFLDKLDLTVNFVDFDELEASIDHLKPLQHLRELYMLGNPSQSNWPEGFHEYVIATLPQLRLLDGKEIHRSDRIKALQVFPMRQRYVREQAVRVRAEKVEARRREELARQANEPQTNQVSEDDDASDYTDDERADDGVIDINHDGVTDISVSPSVRTGKSRREVATKPSMLGSEEKVPYTPHTRREMYMELAEQKEEEESRRRENQPRERNTEAEHELALQEARRQEQSAQDGAIRQCNEGKWDFRIQDEDLDVVLEVDLPRFLDTSLIDVDVHPSYVSIVVKNKLFRLRFPELVHSDQGKAERSKVTGTLRLTLPKANVSATQQLRAQIKREEKEREEQAKLDRLKGKLPISTASTSASRTRKLPQGETKKLSDEVLEAQAKSTATKLGKGAVSIRGLVKKPANENQHEDDNALRAQMTPIVSKTVNQHVGPEEEDEDAPPLIF